MNSFLKKDLVSVIFVASITIFGVFLALLLLGEQTDREKLGSYLSMLRLCEKIS